jgi:hypothetical protein
MTGTDNHIDPTGYWAPIYTEGPYSDTTPEPEVNVTINGFSAAQWLVITDIQASLSRIESLLSKLMEKNE